MGSKVGGVSPGESRARTGAAVGPGSISGLSRKDANQVLNRAERLRGNNITPKTAQIAYESLNLPDRSRPGAKRFALPPSEAIKNIRPDAIDFFLKFQEDLNQPPSMSIPPEIQLPQQPPGYQFTPEVPSTPPGYVPKETFPNTSPPGTLERNMMPMPFRRGLPPESFGQRQIPTPFRPMPYRGLVPGGNLGIMSAPNLNPFYQTMNQLSDLYRYYSGGEIR